MTTIAWDGTTMAGDTLAERGGFGYHVPTKVWKLPDGTLLGGSGSYAQLLTVRKWLGEGGDKPSGIDDLTAIVVPVDRPPYLLEGLLELPLPSSKYAIGSGRDYAIAAMIHYGDTAFGALVCARRFDIYTKGTITTVTASELAPPPGPMTPHASDSSTPTGSRQAPPPPPLPR